MRKNLRKALNPVALALVTLLTFTKAENAKATYGAMDALTTVGVSAGAGAVLGLSTIAFYEKPGEHMNNVVIGTAVGVIVGVGIAAYLMSGIGQEDVLDPDEELIVVPKKEEIKKPDDSSKDSDKKKGSSGSYFKKRGRDQLLAQNLSLYTSSSLELAQLPQVGVRPSGEILVGMQVLELRF